MSEQIIVDLQKDTTEYSDALKAPVRRTGNHQSGERKSVRRCGGATIPVLETSSPEQ